MTPVPPGPTATPLAPQAAAWAAPLMVLAGGMVLGFAPIGLRLGLAELGPQAIAFWRYAFAVPILFALVLIVERRLPRRPNVAVMIAAACFTFDMALWHASLTLTSVSNATFIVNLGNIGVGIAAYFILGERPGKIWTIAACLALGGASALALGGADVAPGALKGDVMALLAAVFVAGYMLYSRLARRSLTGLEAMFWLSVIETVLAFFIVWGSGESFAPATPHGYLAPLALALIVQVLGQGLILSGLGTTPAAIAGILVLAQPVVAAIASWFLFEETLTAIQFGGAGLILFAVWLAQRPQTQPGTGAT